LLLLVVEEEEVLDLLVLAARVGAPEDLEQIFQGVLEEDLHLRDLIQLVWAHTQ